jgi:hypothetical protein
MTGNLLRHFPQESLLVLASRSRGYPIDRTTDIPCAKYYIDLPAWIDRHRTKYFLVPAIVHKALKIASENKIDNIFTHWPNTHFVIAAYFAAKLLKKPLYLWLHSLWEERKLPIHDYVMTRLFEKRIINYAHHLFVATEAEQAFYLHKYGLNSTVLYASVDFSLDEYRKIADTSSAVKKEKTIMFVGAIYPPMNLDSIQRLKKAIDSIDAPKIRLLLCTPIEKEQLKAWGLISPNVEVKFAPKPELMNLLDKADILFLPLAFNSDMPLEIQTVFPTKTLEYLLSKTPILVHAPQGSYISNYA